MTAVLPKWYPNVKIINLKGALCFRLRFNNCSICKVYITKARFIKFVIESGDKLHSTVFPNEVQKPQTLLCAVERPNICLTLLKSFSCTVYIIKDLPVDSTLSLSCGCWFKINLVDFVLLFGGVSLRCSFDRP